MEIATARNVKSKGLYSQSEEDEHDKQIVYDTMYKTRCSLVQVLHTTLHCVKTIQKVHPKQFCLW